MGKNSQIHLYLETSVYEVLKKEAEERKIFISEICREKLGQITQLTRVEAEICKIKEQLSFIIKNIS